MCHLVDTLLAFTPYIWLQAASEDKEKGKAVKDKDDFKHTPHFFSVRLPIVWVFNNLYQPHAQVVTVCFTLSNVWVSVWAFTYCYCVIDVVVFAVSTGILLYFVPFSIRPPPSQQWHGKNILHLQPYHLFGFCLDCYIETQNSLDRSKLRPSQTPTIHPSEFFGHITFSVPNIKL